MYTLTRSISMKDLLTRQLPALLVSLLTAEIFFRFGSFALEAVAFLTTWYLLDVALDLALAEVARRRKSHEID